MARKFNIKNFISKANKVHGGKYDYSKVEYVNCQTKVCIICPEHGEFWQEPSSHLRGVGCPKCGRSKASINRTSSTNKFISKACKIHGDKYDYSKVNYVGVRIKVCIICPEHGEFWQSPNSHLNGYGCPKCGYETVQKKISYGLNGFLNKANKVHGDKYDYSKVEYVNNHTKICIICPEHGEFWQEPSSHLQGVGCPKCSYVKLSNERTKSTDKWVEEVKKIHYDKYDYTLTEYTGYYNKVKIICPIHGIFEQKAYNHLQGKGCPKCKTSKMELDWIAYLNENKIKYIYQYRPSYLKKGRSQLSIDFYLPEYNAAIECQGEQHFTDTTFFEHRKKNVKQRDKEKNKLVTEHGTTLYYYTNLKNKIYDFPLYTDKDKLINEIKKTNGTQLL